MDLKINIALFILATVAMIMPQERSGNFQGGTISGRVFDSSSKVPIEYANIILLSQRDSSLITGTVTDTQGNFKLEKIRPGEFYLDVRFIGYMDKRTEVAINRGSINIQLGDIFIDPSAVNLDNVIIEGERSQLSYQIDKKVIDVSQMQTVVSGNAADVLQNVPSVSVDIEGNVSLRGTTNFTVLVDGRPSVLDPQDILQQIPATSINKIEIITNPSAKYDSEGTGGIINIIMKKDQNHGLSGIVNANAGLNDKYGGDFLFEYKNQIFNSNFGLDYNRFFAPGNMTQENSYFLSNGTSYINSEGDMEWGRIMFGLRGGIDFLLSENDVLSIGGRYGSREMNRNSKSNFVEWTDSDPQQLDYSSKSDMKRSGTFYSLNSNYEQKFSNPDHKLSGELFFSRRDFDESSITSEVDNSIQTGGKKTTETGPSTDLRGKIDYVLPLGEVRKLEAGYQGEIDLSDETTDLYEFNPGTGEYEFQQQFSNETNYDEREHSFYSIYSDGIANLSFQGGLRTEYTFRSIEVTTQNQDFTIDRWDLFPSIHSSYKFDDGQLLMASYTRRIERPGGWALEPFETWIDANNVRRGNPALDPEFIDSYELGGQTFLGGISMSAEFYYRVTNNKIEDVRSVYSDDVILTTFENVGKDFSLGTELMFILDPFEFWNVNLMGNLYNYKVKGILYNESFSRESFNWISRINNVFKISQATQLQLNAVYNSASVSSQGRTEDFVTADVAVKQDLFDRLLSLTLQIRDFLGTAKREFTSEGIDFHKYNYFERESPMVMLNIRLNFNTAKTERDRERERGDGENGFEGGEDY